MRKHKPKAMEKYTMVIYLKAKYHHFNSLKIVLWIQYNFDNFHCNDKIDSIRYLFLKLARGIGITSWAHFSNKFIAFYVRGGGGLCRNTNNS